jgi:UDPglucose 6-dehydrogenase
MTFRIIIIGAGIVGQASGKGLIKKGHDVIFVDKEPIIVERLKDQGFEAYLPNQLDNVKADISMFCVNTPSKKDGSINLNYIVSAIKNHGIWLKNRDGHNYHLVVIRSTVPPGTTATLLCPLIEYYSHKKVGNDFGLCMQPEFMRSHSSEYDFLHPHITVIGEYDKTSGDMLEKVYAGYFEGQISRVSLDTAEFMKYIHNCFNATKISFSNEMWLLGKNLGIADPNLALQLASKSAEGYWNPKYGTIGGRPYGGRCLPKDSKAFLEFTKKKGVRMPLLSATLSVNRQVEKLSEQQSMKDGGAERKIKASIRQKDRALIQSLNEQAKFPLAQVKQENAI